MNIRVGRAAAIAMSIAVGVASACGGGVASKSDDGAGGESGTSGTGGVGVGCFALGTPIATPTGDRSIEALAIGDWVLAYDESSHRVVPAPVVRTFRHEGNRTGELALSSGETLRVTTDHPVFMPDQAAYGAADRVTSGSRLIQLGAAREVRSGIAEGFFLDATAPTEVVFNIEVAVHHNFFAAGVLVHNKQPPCLQGACCLVGSKEVTWNAHCAGSPPCIKVSDAASPDAGAGGESGASADAGLAGSAGAPQDAGAASLGSVERAICAQPSTRSLLAFEVKTDGTPASIAIVATGYACKGIGREVARIQIEANGGGWRSACTWAESHELSLEVAVVSDNPQDELRNLRFVDSCPCALDKEVWNHCTQSYTTLISPKDACP